MLSHVADDRYSVKGCYEKCVVWNSKPAQWYLILKAVINSFNFHILEIKYGGINVQSPDFSWYKRQFDVTSNLCVFYLTLFIRSITILHPFEAGIADTIQSLK